VPVVVSVRDGRPAEMDDLVELQRRASLEWDDYREQLLAHPDAVSLPADALAEGQVRVAVNSDVVVGFATVLPDSSAGTGELDGLFVEPGQWRRGIGRLLIEDAVTLARARGLHRLEVTANPRALGFYEQLGFVTVGEAMTRFGPAIRMHRELST
jgi:GNAT superfamily N-acetyltransferase